MGRGGTARVARSDSDSKSPTPVPDSPPNIPLPSTPPTLPPVLVSLPRVIAKPSSVLPSLVQPVQEPLFLSSTSDAPTPFSLDSVTDDGTGLFSDISDTIPPLPTTTPLPDTAVGPQLLSEIYYQSDVTSPDPASPTLPSVLPGFSLSAPSSPYQASEDSEEVSEAMNPMVKNVRRSRRLAASNNPEAGPSTSASGSPQRLPISSSSTQVRPRIVAREQMVFFNMLENFFKHAESINALQELVKTELVGLDRERQTLIKGLSSLMDCTPPVYSFDHGPSITDQTFDALLSTILNGSSLQELNNLLLQAMAQVMPCDALPFSDDVFNKLPDDYKYLENFDGRVCEHLDHAMLREFQKFLREKEKKEENDEGKGKEKEKDPKLPDCWSN